MNKAVISGDIIASTTFSVDERTWFNNMILQLFNRLYENFNQHYKIYGRMYKGDYIECIIDNPKIALRVALIIKYFIKTVSIPRGYPVNQHVDKQIENREQYFSIYGSRIAIGIGEIEHFDLSKGIFEGEAISFSGRLINQAHTYGKERIVIKDTFYIKTKNQNWDQEFSPVLSLMDVLIAKSTPRQSEVLIEKLFGRSEDEISNLMRISQSAINQRSKGAGWYAIEKAVERFEQVIN